MRPSRIRTAISHRLTRNDRDFVALLGAQIDTCIEAVTLIRDLVAVAPDRQAPSLRDQVGVLERKGDRERARLVVGIGRVIATPIDREDLYRLSRGIDDILDALRDFSRGWELLGARPEDAFDPLLAELLDGLDALRQAATCISEAPSSIAETALGAKKRANEMRKNYQRALSHVLEGDDDDPATLRVLRRRELLKSLDLVGLHLSATADVLADAAIKRSH